MTEIKSVYEWVVILLYKKAMRATSDAMPIIRYSGEENTELGCMERITNLISTKNRDNDYLVMKAEYTFVGEEL